jgi:ABC-2 type transport system ATP-binding protein
MNSRTDPDVDETDRTRVDSSRNGRRLSVSGLSFRYPKQPDPVLRDVSFEVRPGQSLGVLGPNGAGKSTLLNALLKVRPGTRSGTVAFGGVPGIRRTAVGYATQQTALYQQLTVVENIRHVGRMLLPRRAVAAAVDRNLVEFGLTSRADEPVHRLSGGWQRLAHLAAGFVHDPPLRLLDEPTTALDFETRARLVSLVEQWRSAGATVLVTSHYPEDIEEMCTHAVVIRGGTVARHSSVPDLVAGYRRELIITLAGAGGARDVRRPLPDTVRGLGAAVEDLAAREGLRGDRLLGVSTTGTRLRDVLSADPELRGAFDETE